MNDQKTHFGFEQVKQSDKVNRVNHVFSSVASRYDIMNDLMSFGLHRLWKDLAINHLALRPHHQVLDLAGGTGDLTLRIQKRIRPPGGVILSDINPEMLREGKNRLINKGVFDNIEFVQANAEAMPFTDNQFDRVIIGFGLRNVTNKGQALAEIYRCLKPGGLLVILEFSKPTDQMLQKLYDLYSFNVIPKVGKVVTQDEDSYRYLVESIRMHPDQQTLAQLMQQNQFSDVSHINLTGGIVAIHKGYKY